MKTHLLATIAVSALLASCSGKPEGTVTLQPYSYSTLARDTTANDDPSPSDSLWHYRGEGMLPVADGSKAMEQLRDTLEAMGNVNVASDGTAQPGFHDGHVAQPGDPEQADAGNEATNQLNLCLATPYVMVWQNRIQVYEAGAAHGRYRTRYLNYALGKGHVISLDDLFEPGYEKPLLEMLKEKLADNPEIFSDAQITIPPTFRITSRGLAFVWPIYDIAPYSAGEPEVDFDIYELTDLLKPSACEEILSM